MHDRAETCNSACVRSRGLAPMPKPAAFHMLDQGLRGDATTSFFHRSSSVTRGSTEPKRCYDKTALLTAKARSYSTRALSTERTRCSADLRPDGFGRRSRFDLYSQPTYDERFARRRARWRERDSRGVCPQDSEQGAFRFLLPPKRIESLRNSRPLHRLSPMRGAGWSPSCASTRSSSHGRCEPR